MTRSDEGNFAILEHSIPADLAFLAMAHYRLGHRAEAQAVYQRLKAAPLARDGFERETEESRGPVGLWEGKRDEFALTVATPSPEFEQGRSSGRSLSLDEAVTYALGGDH